MTHIFILLWVVWLFWPWNQCLRHLSGVNTSSFPYTFKTLMSQLMQIHCLYFLYLTSIHITICCLTVSYIKKIKLHELLTILSTQTSAKIRLSLLMHPVTYNTSPWTTPMIHLLALIYLLLALYCRINQVTKVC